VGTMVVGDVVGALVRLFLFLLFVVGTPGFVSFCFVVLLLLSLSSSSSSFVVVVVFDDVLL
jgi:hypothetical protein